jgi:8-oxo-dGTP diphosphatase
MYIYKYPRPASTVDIVLIRKSGPRYQILLIKRAKKPFLGRFALPGGFVGIHESLEDAALRELEEETGLRKVRLVQLHTFSAPDRDPRGRVISTAYGTLLAEDDQLSLKTGSDATQVSWLDLSDLPSLAFDHRDIVDVALKKFGLEIFPPTNPQLP